MIISEKKALNFRVILTPVNSKLAEGSALNVASNINRILVNQLPYLLKLSADLWLSDEF